MKIFITGRPGVGKSTLFKEIVEELKERGFKICGFITPEVRERGKRIGFKCIDLNSSKEIWLAKVGNFGNGIKFGRYTVFVKDFEDFLDFVFKNWKKYEWIAIDEIGKMEFFSGKFRNFVSEIMNSDKNVIAVIHRNFADRFKYGEIFWLTRENYKEIRKKIEELIDKN